MPLNLLLLTVLALLVTAAAAVAVRRRADAHTLVYALCLAIAAVGLSCALYALLAGASASWTRTLPLGIPWLGAHLRLDALSAFFLVVINLGGAVSSLYGLGQGGEESEPLRVLPFFPAFLAAMNLVVLADDAFSFLLAWELMSLMSWALVVCHHRIPDNVRAGYVYLTMASFGTLMLLLAFGVLAGADGGYAFESIRAATPSPATAALVLALLLLGAGSKAGLVPLHVWLPLAHPAAPAHVSALMSAVMTKVAVYGFVRVTFDLLGQMPWWAGMAVLVLGGVTAVLGILHAIMATDIKRVLAYSTIENIGVVFVGLGLAMAFRAADMGWAAALALTAAMLHVLNHSLFKNLLFLGAGAVLTATGERRLDRLGGLIHRMPVTAFAVLAGCVAISALPPLNGFVSEWLTFQAILLSPALPQWGLKIAVPAIGAMLALSAALAAACFVRLFGVGFLGRARSAEAAGARETDPLARAAMLVMVALCVGIGIFPGLVIDALAPVVRLAVETTMPAQREVPWLSIVPIAESRSSYNGLLVLVFIAASAWIAAWAIHRHASSALRRAPAWDCGTPGSDPTTQYSAVSFAQPVGRVFGTHVFALREQVYVPAPGEAAPARLVVERRDRIWNAIYAPLADAILAVAERLNHLQFLTIRRYLGLVFLALVALLLVLAIWS